MNIGINLTISPLASINTNDSPSPIHIAGIKFNIIVIFSPIELQYKIKTRNPLDLKMAEDKFSSKSK